MKITMILALMIDLKKTALLINNDFGYVYCIPT